MKTGRNLAIALLLTLIIGTAVSCISTGEYMPLAKDETVIGTVQATFVVRSAMFSFKSTKDAVNKQAYIQLLDAAGKKYSGSNDIRDIVWVTGKSVDAQNTEISATGKVIQVN